MHDLKKKKIPCSTLHRSCAPYVYDSNPGYLTDLLLHSHRFSFSFSSNKAHSVLCHRPNHWIRDLFQCLSLTPRNILCGWINGCGLAWLHRHCCSHNSQSFPAVLLRPVAMGKSQGKRQRLNLHPQQNLGPIPGRLCHKSSWINKLGTWLEKTLGYFSKLQWSRSYICIYVNFESNVRAFASTTP